MAEAPKVCPACGGLEPFHPLTPSDARVCTPLSCSAWKFTHRLTKDGPKAIREDGRADLRIAEAP